MTAALDYPEESDSAYHSDTKESLRHHGEEDSQWPSWQDRGGNHFAPEGGAHWQKGGDVAGPQASSKSVSEGSASKLRRNKWINRQVTVNSGNMQRLLQTIQFHITQMNAINLVTALHRVTKLAVSGNGGYTVEKLMKDPSFQLLFNTVKQQIESLASPPLPGEPKQPPFEVRCMSMVCWSCSTLRLQEERLLTVIAGIAGPRLSELKPFELSNIVWAYAKLSMGLPQLFAAVSERMMDRKPGAFSLQCLSIIAWSFTTAKQKNVNLFSSLAQEIHLNAPDAKPQEIANTLWAYAKNRCVEVPLFNALADTAVTGDMLWSFKPQELSNTVWAFATIGLRHPALFRSVEAVAISKRRELSPQNSANILWAYSKLQVCRHSGLVPALLSASIGKLAQHKPQEISAIVWVAAREDYPACRRFFQATAQIFAHRLHEFPPQALAYMLEAFASINPGTPDFSAAIFNESISRLHQFDPPALTSLLHGAVLFARNSQSGDKAELLRDVRALGFVSAQFAARVAELQDTEVRHASESSEQVPAFVAESARAVGELRQALQQEEHRRGQSQGRASARSRATRRGGVDLNQGNRPLGDIRPLADVSVSNSARLAVDVASLEGSAGNDTNTFGWLDGGLADKLCLDNRLPRGYGLVSESSSGLSDTGLPTSTTQQRAADSGAGSIDELGKKGKCVGDDWLGADLLGPGAPDDDDYAEPCLCNLPDLVEDYDFNTVFERGVVKASPEQQRRHLNYGDCSDEYGGWWNTYGDRTWGTWHKRWALTSADWTSGGSSAQRRAEPSLLEPMVLDPDMCASRPGVAWQPGYSSRQEPAVLPLPQDAWQGSMQRRGSAAEWTAPAFGSAWSDPWAPAFSDIAAAGQSTWCSSHNDGAGRQADASRACQRSSDELNKKIWRPHAVDAGCLVQLVSSTGDVLLGSPAAAQLQCAGWEAIDLEDDMSGAVIGTGGTVVRLRHGLLDARVAVKRMASGTPAWPARVATHPNVLAPCAHISPNGGDQLNVPPDCYIAYHFCEHGTMADWVMAHQAAHSVPSLKELSCILFGLLRITEVFIQHGLGLDGIRTDEIFLDDQGEPLVRLRHDRMTLSPTGEVIREVATGDQAKWMAPEEVGAGQLQWPAAAFRIGLVLYCVLAGVPDPYPQKRGELVLLDLKREVAGSNKPVRPDASRYKSWAVPFTDVVDACLSPQAATRPTKAELDKSILNVRLVASHSWLGSHHGRYNTLRKTDPAGEKAGGAA